MKPPINAVPFVYNWKKKVEILRAGPDFGIHGFREGDLHSILRDSEQCVSGHYFAVGKKEKELPIEEFYKRLWASIDVALSFSAPRGGYLFEVRDGKINYFSKPSLLLGIDIRKGRSGNVIRSNASPRESIFGSPRMQSTFGVGHDFLTSCGIEVKPLLTGEEESKKIDKAIDKFCLSFENQHPVTLAYFASKTLNNVFFDKLYWTIRSVKIRSDL